MTSVKSGSGYEVVPDVYCLTVQIVNVYFVGTPDAPKDWVLIDAGMPRSEEMIINAAERRFGAGCRPRAIILTHGHFDHVGAVVELAEHWDVPVYAHPLELPYLTGAQAYPPPDPSVGGGMVATLSRFFPNDPIDLGGYVHPLPADNTLPDMPGWRWLHTPGHAYGHVSLFRDQDRALIAGDAFVTVKQESLYQVITQHKEVNGPPSYFTPDWDAARESVRTLAALKPQVAMAGHGMAMEGDALRKGLDALAVNFDVTARPQHGRYVDD
nr:MBL fold metallo-hydrolase [Phytohalomonas tamaricis]